MENQKQEQFDAELFEIERREKVRQYARPVEVLDPRQNRAMIDSSITAIRLGAREEGTQSLWLCATGRCLTLYIHESFKGSPYLWFRDAMAPGARWDLMRFSLGGSDPTRKTGATIRLSTDKAGYLHLALPGSPCVDANIIWWRPMTAVEWCSHTHEFEYAHYLAQDECPGYKELQARHSGWEEFYDIEVSDIHFRRRKR